MTTVPLDVKDIIRQKRNLYCQACDLKQWDLLDKVALPEATFQFKHPDGSFVTAALEGEKSMNYDFKSLQECRGFFQAAFAPLQTIHVADGGSFEKVGEDQVKAVFAVNYSIGPASSPTAGHSQGGGYYFEIYTRVGDDWMMKSMNFVLTYQRM